MAGESFGLFGEILRLPIQLELRKFLAYFAEIPLEDVAAHRQNVKTLAIRSKLPVRQPDAMGWDQDD